MNAKMLPVLAEPEVAAGGYSQRDGTVEFYGRVRAVMPPEARVLDLGAGRGAWFADECLYRRNLRDLRNAGATVVACDVDPAVLDHPASDAQIVLGPDHAHWPFDDESFDVIIADYVLEHVADPAWFASEATRVLRRGGWLACRTPNARSYASVATRLVNNRHHVRVLNWAQPQRHALDVFPTTFRLNTLRSVRKWFPDDEFRNATYYFNAEPAYSFGRRSIFRMMSAVDRLLPSTFHANLFVFLQRR